jgi:hypothetical protein
METTNFVKVQKNGVEGKLHITTWERIGKENNKEGWILIPTEPLEVTQIREKKIAAELSNQSESAIAENKPVINEDDIVKTKRKYNKK